jgi:hypothetical protein
LPYKFQYEMPLPFPIPRARVAVFAAIACGAMFFTASPARAAAKATAGPTRFNARLFAMAGRTTPRAQVASRAHLRRLRLSPLQRAFHFGHGTGRSTHQTTQATSSGTADLLESPLAQAAPSRRDLILPSSERIRFDERAGRRASRAPPVITTSAIS